MTDKHDNLVETAKRSDKLLTDTEIQHRELYIHRDRLEQKMKELEGTHDERVRLGLGRLGLQLG